MATLSGKKSLIQLIFSFLLGSCLGVGGNSMFADDLADVAECVIRETTGVDLDIQINKTNK